MSKLKQLKPRLTFANVMSCIALFLALGGAAFAAKTATKVKTKNLVNGAVTTPKLRNGAVTTPKLRNRTVISTKIAAGNVGTEQLAKGAVRSEQLGGGVVTEAKIKDGAVSSGKLAPNFLAQLVRNVSYASAESASDGEDAKTVTALCPSGKEAIGGGARVNGELKDVALTGSTPFVAGDGTRTGWSAFARESEATASSWSLTAFAVCAEI
jgi:hypothetical protein